MNDIDDIQIGWGRGIVVLTRCLPIMRSVFVSAAKAGMSVPAVAVLLV